MRQPIADKLIKKMRSYVGAKVVDLSAVIEGKKNAEELQKTVASRETLADHHPAHALYIYAQNQTSVMAEQLSALPEMDRFTRLIGMAEDEYCPSAPPMSPLTTSFFTCWAFFDACVGSALFVCVVVVGAFIVLFLILFDVAPDRMQCQASTPQREVRVLNDDVSIREKK